MSNVIQLTTKRNPSEEELHLFQVSRGVLVSPEMFPELAHVIYSLHPIATGPELPTLAVDEFWRLYINFDWFTNASHSERTFGLAHECWHILLNHAGEDTPVGRAKNTTTAARLQEMGKLWNLCGDSEINDGLRDIAETNKFLRPIDSAYYAGMLPTPCEDHNTAFHYWDKQNLNDITCPDCGGTGHKSQPSDGNQQGNQDGNQQGNQDGSQPGQGNQPGSQPGQGSQDGNQQGNQPGQGQEACPSCSGTGVNGSTAGSFCGGGSGTGNPLDGELGPDGKIDGKEVPGIDKGLAESVRYATARDIIDNKSRGVGSAEYEWAMAELGKHSKVDWRKELRNSIARSIANKRGHSKRTFARPARRNLNSSTTILPSRMDIITDVLFGTDTSGSMSDEDYAYVAGEVDAILTKHKGKLALFSIDGDVHATSTQIVKSLKGIKLKGGGGTDMRKGFEYISQYREKFTPGVGIIATDGHTPWPDEEWFAQATNAKGQPIQWVVIGTSNDVGQYDPIRNIPKVSLIVVADKDGLKAR